MEDLALLGMLSTEVLLLAVKDLIKMSPLWLVENPRKIKELCWHGFFDLACLLRMGAGDRTDCRLFYLLAYFTVEARCMVIHFDLKLVHPIGL